MVGIKRKADDDHKELVISNVEFCMLQFYKSQFEAAQTRIQQQQRQIKKTKRESDHKDARIRELVNTNVDYLTEIHSQSQLLGQQQEQLHHAVTQRDEATTRLWKAEARNIQFNVAVDRLLVNHPEIDDEERQTFEDIGVNSYIHTYDSDESTEPDTTLYMI